MTAIGLGRPARRAVAIWRWTALTVLIAIGTGATVWWLARRTAASPTGPMIRAILPLEGVAVSRLVGKDDTTIAVSPDGRLLAYVIVAHTAIVLHDLPTGQSRTLVTGGEIGQPFFLLTEDSSATCPESAGRSGDSRGPLVDVAR